MNNAPDKMLIILLLDLSGVAIVDKIVAEGMMQLINALKVIGVITTLSGVRPEIAQGSVRLGVTFDDLSIKSSLAEAILYRELHLQWKELNKFNLNKILHQNRSMKYWSFLY